jgi:quercetin dioxygenase-like cupin family protein
MRLRSRLAYLLVGLLMSVGLLLAGPDSLAQSSDEAATPEVGTPASATPAAGVVREVLSETEPATAPGELFQLVRYTIPTDTTLAAHTHPGIQMNVIEGGVLTYYVVAEGEVIVTRVDGTVETFGPGESTTLHVDDRLIEPAGVVHYGANLGDEPVIILTASLLAADEPASTAVELATPAASN